MAMAVETVAVAQPLPLIPVGSVRISDAVWVAEDADGAGSVFIWGHVSWCWQPGDTTARKLAAVQLVETKAAFSRQVATAFGVDEDTLLLWRRSYESEGVEGLVPKRRGPKGPSKLTVELQATIASLRAEGLTITEVAERAGASRNMVARSLVMTPASVVVVTPEAEALVPLAQPVPRVADRQLARIGLITEAAPVITQGSSLPLVGALVILPALAATGLIEAATSLYATGRAAFYGVRALVLTVVFAALIGEPRAEGLTRVDPADLGRLLGLDRVPEVKTLRRRLGELAGTGRAATLIDALARRHLGAGGEEISGIFYVDGHVRAYHGTRQMQKAHVARIRLAMPAVLDTWVGDRFGDGLLLWQAASSSLISELKTVAASIRTLVGEAARPTICFDRGGWSPRLFAEMKAAGFDILTYRKAPLKKLARRAFTRHVFTDDSGASHEYWLAERTIALAYDNRRRRFSCRQITRLDPLSGHQTHIVTTRQDPDPAPVAHLMFSRWTQENFFKYMRAHYALDALDSYATVDEDPERLVPNPARREADRKLNEARSQLKAAQVTEGRAAVRGRAVNAELRHAFVEAEAEIERLRLAARAIPAKLPLGQVHPEMVRPDPECKRIMDAIRMATYNAESALSRLLGPHYARSDDEGRTLLREVFRSPADLEIVGEELHVRINTLSAPRRTRAIAALCEELTATETLYPGTDLKLIYTVKGPR
jgi:transposase-like protein